MYLVFVMCVYFTIRDIQLIKGCIRGLKKKRKLPELKEPIKTEYDDQNELLL